MTIWNILLVAALAVSCVLSARLLIHYFQLESYQFQGYFRTVKRNLLRSFLPGIVLNLVFIGAGILLVLIIPEDNLWLPGLLLSLCLLAAGALIHRSLKKAKQKYGEDPKVVAKAQAKKAVLDEYEISMEQTDEFWIEPIADEQVK